MKEPKTFVPLALLVGAAGVLLYGALNNGQGWGGDFASYILQAKSLTEGTPRNFIEANRFTIEQSSYIIGPVAYPWGFPILLAPVYAIFGLNMIALKIIGVVSYLIFLATLGFGFRRVHEPVWLIILVGLFALNPSLLEFADHVISDLPFLLLSTLSVLLMGSVVVEERRLISPFWDHVLIGVGITAAFFVRSNGVLLLFALGFAQIVSYLLRQRPETDRVWALISPRTLLTVRRDALKPLLVGLTPYAVFLFAVVILGLLLPEGGGSYINELKDVSLASIEKNLHGYLEAPSEFFYGTPHPQLLFGASLPLALIGVGRRYRSDYHAIAYIVLTLCLSVIWPARPGLKFLFPILPFYISFVISGLEAFRGGTSRVDRAARNLVRFAPVALVIYYFGSISVRNAVENMSRGRETSFGPFTATSRSMFSFVANQTEAESTIVFWKPRVMRLMTDRPSLVLREEDQVMRGDYLCMYVGGRVYDQVSVEAVEALVAEGAARLLYENSDFRVYRLGDGQ
jgi:hypothetical protein